jgi:hypothetical protein
MRQIINDILQSSDNQLSNLIAKVNQLNELNQSLSKILDSKLAAHCQITNLENGILTILVDNSSWGTKIRYTSPDIINKMHDTNVLSKVKSIKCIVRPGKYERTKTKQPDQKLTISAENAQLLRSIAQGVKDKKLREALMKLAEKDRHPAA